MSVPTAAAVLAASDALPIVVVIATAGIVALCIAAWVIRDVARLALQKSATDDVPRVLTALGGWLEQLRLFLPWQEANSGRGVTSRDDQANGDTDRAGNLSTGGPQ
jgi:hypothetical protein